jgi:A/G-specific adenine glycosylase
MQDEICHFLPLFAIDCRPSSCTNFLHKLLAQKSHPSFVAAFVFYFFHHSCSFITNIMNLSPHSELQERVLDWYAAHGRDFFWRTKGLERPEAYITLISEVMLQQTQTSRVQEKLPRFLEQFPAIGALANADNATVIKAWQGMGYNSRALRLRDCARAVVEHHGGIIPSTIETLLLLPGIGPYTASAVAAFAYHHDVPVVDVNIRRVYSRLLQPMPTTIDTLPLADITPFAASIIPRGRSSDWHQALMDIGATYCTARTPKCWECPLADLCASAGRMKENTPTKRPEPSFRGQPNRIWRGRIVEMLRHLPESDAISTDEILSGLFSTTLFSTTPESREEEQMWLMRILEGLEKDRIVQLARNTRREFVVRLATHTTSTGSVAKYV